LRIPLKDGIEGEREGDFMDNVNNYQKPKITGSDQLISEVLSKCHTFCKGQIPLDNVP